MCYKQEQGWGTSLFGGMGSYPTATTNVKYKYQGSAEKHKELHIISSEFREQVIAPPTSFYLMNDVIVNNDALQKGLCNSE